MESRKILRQLTNPLLIVAFAALMRLVPHPPNFAPIAALAIFGGVYLDKRYALAVPFVAMFISDLFLGFHDTMPFVYTSFLLSGLIGLWLKGHKKIGYIIGGTLLSSILFFLITNFGVWLAGSLYPRTLPGLLESYTLALPFFRNTFLGDLFYTGLFFTSFELAKSHLAKQITRA